MHPLRSALLTLCVILSVMAPSMLGSHVSLTPESSDAGPRDPPCPATNAAAVGPSLVLSNQSCLQISLGTLTPGSVVSIDIDISGENIDVLMFAANSIDAYLNGQAYRTSNFWESDASLESITGANEWHWEVPTDRSETAWFLILDNLAHAGDGGAGGQGMSDANITISVTFPIMSYWTLTDSLQVLSPGSNMALLDPTDLTLDEGTQISVTAIPLTGVGDLFILTESQKDTYLMGGGGAFWVPGTQLLSITSPTTNPWIVTSDMAGEPLYLFIDNEAGPTGGGDGLSELRITVSVTLLPALDPVISSADELGSVDVGEEVGLDVNATPNLSNQADLTQTEWDFDGDSIVDATGSTVTTSWSSPGSRIVLATIHGDDGRSSNSSISVVVSDETNPEASILGSNIWHRDVNANFTLTSTSTDNWQIQREEWRVDGQLVTSFTQAGSQFTHSLNATGNHTVELTAVDPAGNIDATVVTIVVRDGTNPVVSDIAAVDKSLTGETVSFTVTASDPESSTLNYTWDFDKESDADNDGDATNDVQATGSSATWTFNSAKPTYVTCTVTNEVGLNRTVEHLVDVEKQASTGSASSLSIPGGILSIIGLVLLLVAAGGGYFLWSRRQDQLALEELTQQQAAEQEPEREPEKDEQLAMYAPQGSYLTGRTGASAEIEAIAGVTATSATLLSDDALDELTGGDPVASQPVVEKDPILDDLDFLRKREKPKEEAPASEPPQVDETDSRTAKRSSGVSLPDSVGATPTPRRSEPAPEPEPAAQASDDEGVTTVKTACPACEQAFAVDMPHDLDEAMVACPNCEQKIKLQR